MTTAATAIATTDNPEAEDWEMTARTSPDREEVEAGERRHDEGHLLWARLSGYCYWPGVITVDPVDGLTVKREKATTKLHVHFLGYENQRAWVHDAATFEFRGYDSFKLSADNAKGQKKKDFLPSRRLRRFFDSAVRLAEEVMPLTFSERLEKLGLIYVLVDERKSKPRRVRTKAAKKLIPSLLPKVERAVEDAKAADSLYDFVDEESEPLMPSFGQLRNHLRTPESASPGVAKSPGSDDGGRHYCVPPPSKKRKKKKRTHSSSSSSSNRPKPLPLPVIRVSSPYPNDIIRDINGDGDDEFASDGEADDSSPKLGGLVWGRMAGFPYWPCFITKNPDGDFRRDLGGTKRVEYHAQFFNWNDESGWVTKILPWSSMEEYKEKAGSISKSRAPLEWKAYHPQGKNMQKKWEAAFQMAQSTAKLSRRERHDQHVVFYNPPLLSGELPLHLSFLKSKPVHVKQKRKTKHGPRSKVHKPDDDKASPKRKKRRRRRKKKNDSSAATKGTADSNLSILPPGWSVTILENGSQEFCSPDGATFPDLAGVVQHLFRQNAGPIGRKRSYSFSESTSAAADDNGGGEENVEPGWFIERSDKVRYEIEEEMTDVAGSLEGPICYHRDMSLPRGWLVKIIRKSHRDTHTEKLYVSPEEKDIVFSSKVEVACYLESKGHPAVELEQLISLAAAKRWHSSTAPAAAATTVPTDPEPPAVLTINLTRCNAEDILGHPLLGKTVIPCYVDMVMLPDIFLEHPTVAVRENDNEMVITDVLTNEFIAKKIMYE